MARTDPGRAQHLGRLAGALLSLFEATADIGVLREAIKECRTAAALAQASGLGAGQYNRDLRELLLRLFEKTTDLDTRHLEQALRWSYPAAGDVPQGSTVTASWLSELASALQGEYQRTDDLPSLRDAVGAARRAVEVTRPGDPSADGYRESHASLLWLLSGRDGDPETLDEALSTGRAALRDMPPGSAERAALLNLLALILKLRYQLTGDISALRTATEHGRDAVSAAPLPGTDAAAYRGNLADALRMLAERAEDRALAREAVALAREAAGGLRPDDPEWAGAQAVLGDSLRHLAEVTGDEQAIGDAVRWAQRAVSRTPVRHPDYLPRLSLLARALMLQYDRTREASLLDQAVGVARDLVGTAPPDHPDRGQYLSLLSAALRESARRGSGSRIRDLVESAELAKEAAARIPPGHPGRAASLASLSHLLRLLYDTTGEPRWLRELLAASKTIARMSGASAVQRITAAQQAAQAGLRDGRGRDAMAMVQLAAELLPQLGLRDVDRADRERRVSAAHRLPATAAAVAIAAGRPGQAVELLEQTRGVVFAGTLDTREDTDELRRAAPDLLPRFQRIREEINAADHEITLPALSGHSDATGRHPRELAARRTALGGQWDQLLREIRQRPGLAEFQRPMAIADLARHAGRDPVVYIVADEFCSHALIVRDVPDAPATLVGLPAAVTRAAVLAQASELRAAQSVATGRGQTALARRNAQRRMLAVLAWTWDNITERVLSALGHTGPPNAGETWPRLWWCPVGVVTLLPLHAAGHHGPPAGADTVLDRVISSYTPTIRALAHARRGSPGEEAALIVAVPDAPGCAPLSGAAQEAAVVREFIPGAAVLPAAGRGTVGRGDVLEALRRHGIVHLACHGHASLDDPSASRLLLHDHQSDPLTLHAITRLNLRRARLAYLSACSTTDAGQRQADEATHLTAAFQLTGYRSIIGTLWPINDQAALDVARDFYAGITAGGTRPPDPGLAAPALHHAVRNLRDAAPLLPSRWAAYVHSGA
jgi:hypothetical protein